MYFENKDIIFVLGRQMSFSSLLNFSNSSKKIDIKMNNLWLHKLKEDFPNEKFLNLSPSENLRHKTAKEKYLILYFLRKTKDKLPEIKTLEELYNLKSLNLEDYHADVIPSFSSYLINLEEFSCSYYKQKIPNSIGTLYNLKILSLENNELKKIPDSIGKLSNLEKLLLTYNKLEEIPDSIGKLSKLKILDVYHNKLIKIPPSIGHLTNLEILSLHNNKLKEIPDSIGNLINLRNLGLSDNKLEKIPNSLGYLSSLKCLYLSINKLEEIPETICQLTNLETLELDGNKLKKIPVSLRDLPKLVTINLDDNELEIPFFGKILQYIQF